MSSFVIHSFCIMEKKHFSWYFISQWIFLYAQVAFCFKKKEQCILTGKKPQAVLAMILKDLCVQKHI